MAGGLKTSKKVLLLPVSPPLRERDGSWIGYLGIMCHFTSSLGWSTVSLSRFLCSFLQCLHEHSGVGWKNAGLKIRFQRGIGHHGHIIPYEYVAKNRCTQGKLFANSISMGQALHMHVAELGEQGLKGKPHMQTCGCQAERVLF